MLEQLNLRRASIAEADKLGRLAFAAWDSSMRHVIDPESEDAMDAERAALELSFQLFCITTCSAITVAEYDGALVGWAAREPMSDYISDLWVAPQHQR